MAGQPKKRAILNYLQAQAQLEECTPLEWVEHWVESGKTLVALADAISEVAGLTVERGQLSRIVNELEPGAEGRLANARTRGGHALLELNVADTDALSVSEDSALVQKQRELNSQRSRIAAVWNRELAEQKGSTSVAITINTMHLDALRRANTVSARIVNPPHATLGNTQDVEIADVSVELLPPGDSAVTA